MDQRATQGVASRFAAYIEHLSEVIGHADRREPLAAYCTGLLLPGERKSVEPMAARTAPGRGRRQAPVAAAFCRQGAVGRGRCSPRCARCAAGDRAAGADRGLDHRRHRLSQEGQAFGRRGAAVLRPARQAGQLPGRGVAVGGQSITPACRSPTGSICPRPGPTIRRGARRPACRRRSRSRPSRRSRSTRSGRPVQPACRAASCWRMPATASTPLPQRARPTGPAYVAGIQSLDERSGRRARRRCRRSRGRGSGRPPKLLRRDAEHQPVTVKELALEPAGARPGRRSRWREGTNGRAHLALRRAARAAGASRLLARRAVARGMAADRMARGRDGADQILALDPAGRHAIADAGRYGQAALAHRARLPGAQAGARPRPLRGPRLARLPPSRHALHRSLRIPRRRAESNSPLSTRPPSPRGRAPPSDESYRPRGAANPA